MKLCDAIAIATKVKGAGNGLYNLPPEVPVGDVAHALSTLQVALARYRRLSAELVKSFGEIEGDRNE
jgi:hypothetical protein